MTARVRCLVLLLALAGAGGALARAALAQAAPIPAFPGAEGFGMWTRGGRGGDVYVVTTLADYGEDEAPIPGSLRAAVEASGPRTVVFAIGGYLDLVRPLGIREPFLTVAGQTAPGDGVTIRRYGLDVWAPEVILRHLRVRPGADAHVEQDAVNLRNGPAIVDHVSASWATDETLSIVGAATDVTVQRTLVAESLNRSVHRKGAHGYGTLITASGDVTIHHSVYAFHESRSPRPKDVLLDFRHNLVAGYGDQPGYTYDDFLRMNHVGVVLQPRAFSRAPACAFHVGGTNARIFAQDNLRLASDGPERDPGDWLCATRGVAQSEIGATVRVAVPFAAPSVTATPAEDLLGDLLPDVGATRPRRDAADARIASLLARGAGQILDAVADAGGWPALDSGTAAEDTDRDGMADAWERAHGLDPSDPADHRADRDGDGYTNLEEWLNETDPAVPFPWAPPPALTPVSGTPFTDSLVVTVETRGLPVHVTLDGTEPTAASPRYAGPLTLRATSHLRARIVQDGVETTAAVGAYPRLAWQRATTPSGGIARGLAAATYLADDWDEGPPPEALTPSERRIEADPDAVLARPTRGTAVLLDGWLDVPADGIYTFWLRDHPRSRLLVDGVPVSPGMPSDRRPAQLALRAGQHRFGLRSLHEEPQRGASLTWAGPGFDRRPIPTDLFTHDTVR